MLYDLIIDVEVIYGTDLIAPKHLLHKTIWVSICGHVSLGTREMATGF